MKVEQTEKMDVGIIKTARKSCSGLYFFIFSCPTEFPPKCIH